MACCAIDGCEAVNYDEGCGLAPGPDGRRCVVRRFAWQPKHKPKTYAEAEGLKQNALSFPGAKKKRASAKKK